MARRFPTVSDNILVSSNAAFTVASGTAGGWVKNTTNVATTQGAIYGRISGSNSGGFMFLQDATTNKLEIAGWDQAGSLQVDMAGGVDLHDGNWHHVAFVFDTANGATNLLYVDGLQGATTTSSAAWPMNNQLMQWGGNGPAGNWANLNESVAEWFFSSVKFTAGEIAGLAKGARDYNFRSNVGYWPFDGLVTPEPDLSGNLHNTTFTGSPVLAFGPPLTQFTPRWHRFTASMAPLAGLGWIINRRNKLMVRK